MIGGSTGGSKALASRRQRVGPSAHSPSRISTSRISPEVASMAMDPSWCIWTAIMLARIHATSINGCTLRSYPPVGSLSIGSEPACFGSSQFTARFRREPRGRGVPTGYCVMLGVSPAVCCHGSTTRRPCRAWRVREHDLSRFFDSREHARMGAWVCRSGEIGKRAALKMRCSQGPAGSSPASGTNPFLEVRAHDHPDA